MTVAAQPVGEAPISAQPGPAKSSQRPPRTREAVAKPDAVEQPEPR